MHLPFDNSYAQLPERFFASLAPTPVRAPGLIALNDNLANELGIEAGKLAGSSGLDVLSGNSIAVGSAPIAQAYAGHQFGNWVPQLGDGRAILLGEIVDMSGKRRDIQLKGAGPTPFSRRGDGRNWIGPVMREYIVSEAMHAFGVPTTRALAAVTTGERVQRERAFPGAILTRVASSHIRVGTFQYFAAREDRDALRTLMNHVIARHYPDVNGPLGLIRAVTGAQARLIAKWMGLGFIHGVMNTDNMSVAGETIDYGPCAFMDVYHSRQVFSSIDRHGRYAYDRQPEIAVWNLAQFATALLPVMGDNREQAIADATEAIHSFADEYSDAWEIEFTAKLGIKTPREGDAAIAYDLLRVMDEGGADFTRTFQALSGSNPADAAQEFRDSDGFALWLPKWLARVAEEGTDTDRTTRMKAKNPALIPRNHRVEEAIAAGLGGDFVPFHRLNSALQNPYDLAPENQDLALPPLPEERVTQTFCGT